MGLRLKLGGKRFGLCTFHYNLIISLIWTLITWYFYLHFMCEFNKVVKLEGRLWYCLIPYQSSCKFYLQGLLFNLWIMYSPTLLFDPDLCNMLHIVIHSLECEVWGWFDVVSYARHLRRFKPSQGKVDILTLKVHPLWLFWLTSPFDPHDYRLIRYHYTRTWLCKWYSIASTCSESWLHTR